MHEEILEKLDRCKKKLKEIWAQFHKMGGGGGGELKSKSVYMAGCALILHYFVVEHIPAFRTDLISVVSPRMLKWDVMPQYQTLKVTHL